MDSGNVYLHPFKRARTTGTYLAAATYGTDADRALIRAEVDRVHAQVRSRPSSPVRYNAFDPNLQLWVAACLYRYYIDQHEFLYGPLDDQSADAIYADARTLGTTLQVREEMWPADRAAFDDYWKRTLDDLRIDEPVREHLHGGGIGGVPADATSAVGWAADPVRHQGISVVAIPRHDESGLDTGRPAPVRLAVDGTAHRRSRRAAGGLAVRLSVVPVGYADPGAPG